MKSFMIFLTFAQAVLVLSRKPNIVLVLTDDQDVLLDSMVAMPKIVDLVATEGVVLENAFVNSPICCPSRSTILTGKYLHNTGVHNNSLSGNCSSVTWQQQHEPFTFSNLLKRDAGYSTFYAGKYLNEYGNQNCGGTEHVPPGYDWWLGLKGNSVYYNYTLSINGTAMKFTDEYLTDVMKAYALSFLNQKQLEKSPFFLMLSPPAAHAPFTPAPRHRQGFPKAKAVRTPSFNYSSKDKHWLVTMPPQELPTDVTYLDDIHKHRLETLLAVDEMVEEIITQLKAMDVLEDTFVIVTSDNGFHIGQFGQPWDKRQPYETDIRVPMLVRGPNVRSNRTVKVPVSSVDLAPTILEMAGLEAPQDMDGRSFLKHILVGAESSHQEKSILIEYFGEGDRSKIDSSCPWVYDDNLTGCFQKECSRDSWCKCQDSRNNTYSCIRRFSSSANIKLCEFNDDQKFVELYDLEKDPFELVNIYHDFDKLDDYRTILHKLVNCKGAECHL